MNWTYKIFLISLFMVFGLSDAQSMVPTEDIKSLAANIKPIQFHENPPFHKRKFLFSDPELDIFALLKAYKMKEINEQRAVELLETASKSGHEGAQQQLYKCYTTNAPFPLKNLLKASQLLKEAATDSRIWALKEQTQQEKDTQKKLVCLKKLEKLGDESEYKTIFNSIPFVYQCLFIAPKPPVDFMLTKGKKEADAQISLVIKAAISQNFSTPLVRILGEIDERKETSTLSEPNHLKLTHFYNRILKEAAELGNVKCMAAYGLLMQTEANEKDMLIWLKKAAELGNDFALNQLAVFYFEKGNVKEALNWGQRAAQGGNADVMMICGQIYQNMKKFKIAYGYYFEAAKCGFTKALYNAGAMLNSLSMPEQALEIFQELALTGQVEAANSAGIIHHVRKNTLKAIEWYEKALELGKNGFGQAEPETIYSALWELYAESGDLAKAFHNFKLYTKYNDLDAKAHFGIWLLKQGKIEQSQPFLYEASFEGHLPSILSVIVFNINFENFHDALFWLEYGLFKLGPSSIFGQLAERIDDSGLTEFYDYDSWIYEFYPNPEQTPTSEKKADSPAPTSQPSPKSEKTLEPSSEKKTTSLNAKGKREQLRQLAELRKKRKEDIFMPPPPLKTKSQKTAQALLTNDSNTLKQDDIKKLFKDPFFQGRVRVVDNSSGGIIVLAYHPEKKKHIKTGGHAPHGQEKYVGEIHPQFRKDIVEILKLFDVK